MAEYYPLLVRAVATLREAPAEKRRAIYDRARDALLGQLRSMQPAVPEDAIMRESTALDEAIERIEAEMARAKAAPAAEPPAVIVPPPPPPEPVPPAPSEPAVSVAARDVAPPAAPAPSVDAPDQAEGPAATTLRPRSPTARPLAAPPRSTAPRPASEALQRLMADQGKPPPVIRADRSDDEETRQRAANLARAAAALPSAPRLQVPSFADAVAEAGQQAEQATRDNDAGAAPVAEKTTGPDEAVRPAAPRPSTRERFNPRALILAVIGALVVLGIAYTAYRLRDKPEALARSRAARIAAEQAEAQRSDKLVNRAETDGASVAGAGAVAPPATVASPPPAPAPDAPSAASTAVGPIDAGAGAPAEQASIPVAQRAAFLIDAPDDPQKVKTYVGTVVWRKDSINPGQGQPLIQAVHADVDIPDVGLKLTVVLQKNLEAQFPASHTLDLRFTPDRSGSAGGVKQINVPQMRKDDSPTGDPLVGLPVTITENYFLVGLSRGEAGARNIDLIKSRNWFDIPLLMTSGKVAKITFEKGATGLQVVDQVVESWQ